MKTLVTNFILDCLNGRINEGALAKIKPNEWSDIIELAKKKHLSTIIFYNLKKSDSLHLLPEFVIHDLENYYYSVLTQNMIGLGELTTILKALNRLDIKAIILKGAAFINTIYNGNYALRPMVDIDILIHPEQLELTKQCLKELGYHINSADFGSVICSLNKDDSSSLFGKLNIEIHWQILHNKFSRVLNINEKMFWMKAQTLKIEDVDCLGLSVEDNILYLSLHLTLIHFFSDLIWLYDIKRIIEVYKNSIWWDRLFEMANRSGTKNIIYYCLTYSKSFLGAPLENSIIERFSPTVLKKKAISYFLKKNYILGDYNLNKISYIVQFLMFGIKDMIKLALANIFPDKELLKYRYPNDTYFKAYISYVLRPFKIFSPKVLVGKQRAFN